MKKFQVAGIDMPCIDLALSVDQFPKPNGGQQVNSASWQGGGKVATGMVAAARLGAKCAIMGAVGEDNYGKFCIEDFKAHGIDVSGMQVQQGKTTSLSIVISDKETRGRSIVYNAGTAQLPTLEEVRTYCLQQVDTLWEEVKRFDNPHTFYVDLSKKLWDIKYGLLKDNAK